MLTTKIFSGKAIIFTLFFTLIQVFSFANNIEDADVNLENQNDIILSDATESEKETLEVSPEQTPKIENTTTNQDINIPDTEEKIEEQNQKENVNESDIKQKSKKVKSNYDIITTLLSDHDSITKNDGFLKTGITAKTLFQQLAFIITSLGIGTLVYLPTAKSMNVNFKKGPYPTFLEYFVIPFMLSYIFIRYGYKYNQKSKINVRVLKRLLKNWKFLKDKMPHEIKKMIKPLRSKYKKNNFNLKLKEKNAHTLITDIFKVCINKKNNLDKLDLKDLLLNIVSQHPEILSLLKHQ